MEEMRKSIKNKQIYAKIMLGLPPMKKVPVSNEIAMEIMEQIVVCEELGRGLSLSEIKMLCQMTSLVRIGNFCKAKKCA